MEKFSAIYTYLKGLDETTLVNAWNTYCEQKFSNEKIYLNNSKNILGLFPSSAYLAGVLTYPSKYDRKDKYFTFVGKRLYSFNDIFSDSTIAFDLLTGWIIENGDQRLNFIGIDDYLEDAFISEYFGDMADGAKKIIDKVSKDEPIDFLMEAWDDIAANLYFDVIVTNANNKR